MPAWLIQIIDVIRGGSETTTLTVVLRAAVIGCSLLALVQLTVLWGTRWGDRNSLAKSFFLSLFVHLCVMLGWASVAEPPPVPMSEVKAEVPPPIPVQVVWDDTRFQSGSSNQTGLGRMEAQQGLGRGDQKPGYERRQQPTGDLQELPSTVTPQLRATSIEVPGLPLVEVSATTPAIESREVSRSRSPVPSTVAPLPQNDQEPTADPPQADRTGSRSRRVIDRIRDPSGEPQEPPTPMPTRSGVNRPRPEMLAPLTPTSGNASTPLVEATTNQVVPNLRRAQRAEPTELIESPGGRMGTSDSRPASIGKMILRGIVTDAQTGHPLAGARIHYDRLQGPGSNSISAKDGSYEMRLEDVPDHFAVTATLDGYLPESRSVNRSNDPLKPTRLDFSLYTANGTTIALESNPTVRHLGNDRFEGRINSQFQRQSVGESTAVKFRLTADQLRARSTRAVLVFMAKGMQCTPEIRMNGQSLRMPTDLSPADGSFGPLTLAFDPALLKVGENVVQIQAIACNGDLDDFEFVNLQIKLLPPE